MLVLEIFHPQALFVHLKHPAENWPIRFGNRPYYHYHPAIELRSVNVRSVELVGCEGKIREILLTAAPPEAPAGADCEPLHSPIDRLWRWGRQPHVDREGFPINLKHHPLHFVSLLELIFLVPPPVVAAAAEAAAEAAPPF